MGAIIRVRRIKTKHPIRKTKPVTKQLLHAMDYYHPALRLMNGYKRAVHSLAHVDALRKKTPLMIHVRHALERIVIDGNIHAIYPAAQKFLDTMQRPISESYLLTEKLTIHLARAVDDYADSQDPNPETLKIALQLRSHCRKSLQKQANGFLALRHVMQDFEQRKDEYLNAPNYEKKMIWGANFLHKVQTDPDWQYLLEQK